ncbi:NAD(P)/FAD-dependent oxidoreductase [Clostridium hydrogeniformans]|uniref:NAD(P)/FAD-dependent oxidoreductase n=1 Tax=Clostridium hydrogeniformans TaxID=349933 RepID=UPI0004840B4F|nr:FAD-dependent oxidoreductase [Clostridium hydrogeniformans]
MKKNYLIIGSGVASISAAKAIRDADKDGNISIYGEEASLPYSRIKLSKNLMNDLNNDKILLKKPQWYEENNIKVFDNIRISSIDIKDNLIVTSEGEKIPYYKLLITTGANNRSLPIPGNNKKGVFTLRDIMDANNIRTYLEGRNNVVHIGGGIQGLETAWTLHTSGKKVSIIEIGDRLMAKQLDKKASLILKNKIEESGVNLFLNTTIDEVLGSEKVEGIAVNKNKILPCDSIIYSIGITPNIEIIRNTEIKVNKGIIVNDNMETSVNGIYAAGDVAELQGAIEGLWTKAMDQGKVSGSNMAGNNIKYKKAVPITMLNGFNISLLSIGDVNEGSYDDSIEEEINHKYIKIFIKNNKVVGAISIGDVTYSQVFKTSIEKEVSLDGINLKNISIKNFILEIKNRLKS